MNGYPITRSRFKVAHKYTPDTAENKTIQTETSTKMPQVVTKADPGSHVKACRLLVTCQKPERVSSTVIRS